MWKQRSVSAVPIQISVVRADFVAELLSNLPECASVPFLGAWAGALAIRTGKRIVYTPFMSGVSNLDWRALVSRAEHEAFTRLHQDLMPDVRFYSPHLSRERPYSFANSV
jgi:hypothetical protein